MVLLEAVTLLLEMDSDVAFPPLILAARDLADAVIDPLPWLPV